MLDTVEQIHLEVMKQSLQQLQCVLHATLDITLQQALLIALIALQARTDRRLN